MSREGINVCIRVRPFIQREIDNGETNCEDWIIKSNSIHNMKQNKRMTFDRVFYHVDNRTVYDNSTQRIVESAIDDGLNGTILCYGQTSSGKTFTMSSVMEFAFLDMWQKMQADRSRNYIITISYCEVYNESVIDLLDPTKTNLGINASTGEVIGLTRKDVSSVSEMLLFQFQGQKNRKTGATKMNQGSSRSHSIFQVYIKSTPSNNNNNSLSMQSSFTASTTTTHQSERIGTLSAQLNFVDLAGSESQKQTEAKGDRLAEGAQINRSLLTLGKVIRALGARKPEQPSYRESKLTLILRHSLGGNCRTAVICCITLSTANHAETQSTLLFAEGAKNVINVVCSNEELDEKQLFLRLSEQYNVIHTKFGEILYQIKSQVETQNQLLLNASNNNIFSPPSTFLTIDLPLYELIAQQHGIGFNGEILTSNISAFRSGSHSTSNSTSLSKLSLTTHVSSSSALSCRSLGTLPQTPSRSGNTIPNSVNTPTRIVSTSSSRLQHTPNRNGMFFAPNNNDEYNQRSCFKKQKSNPAMIDSTSNFPQLETSTNSSDNLVQLSNNNDSMAFQLDSHICPRNNSTYHFDTSIGTDISVLSMQYQQLSKKQAPQQYDCDFKHSPNKKRSSCEQITSVADSDEKHVGFSSIAQEGLNIRDDGTIVNPVEFYTDAKAYTPNPVAVLSKLGLLSSNKYNSSMEGNEDIENDLHRENHNLNFDLDKLTSDLDTLLQSNGIKTEVYYSNQISMMNNNLMNLQSQYDELLTTYNSHLDEQHNTAQTITLQLQQINQHDILMKKYQQDYSQLQLECDAVNMKLVHLEGEKSTIQTEIKLLHHQLEITSATHKSDIQTYLQQIKSTEADYQSRYALLQTRFAQLQTKYDVAQNAKNQLQTQLLNAKDDHNEYIEEYKDETNHQVTQLQSQLEQVRLSNQSDREKVHQKYKSEILLCEETIDTLEEELVLVDKEKKSLEQHVDDLEAELEDMKMTQSTKQGEFQAKLQLKESLLCQYENNMKELKDKQVFYEAQCVKYGEQVNQHQNELDALRQQIWAQDQSVKSKEFELQQAGLKYDGLSQKHQLIDEQYQENKFLLKELKDELKTANQTILELNKQHQIKMSEYETKMNVLEQTKGKNNRFLNNEENMFNFDFVVDSTDEFDILDSDDQNQDTNTDMINDLETSSVRSTYSTLSIRSLLATATIPRNKQQILQQFEYLKSLQKQYKELKVEFNEVQKENKNTLRKNKQYQNDIESLQCDNEQLTRTSQQNDKKLTQQNELMQKYQAELQTYSITSSISSFSSFSPSFDGALSSSSFLSPTLTSHQANGLKIPSASLSATLLPSQHSSTKHANQDLYFSTQQVDLIKFRYETELEQKQTSLKKKEIKYTDLKSVHKALLSKYQSLLENQQQQIPSAHPISKTSPSTTTQYSHMNSTMNSTMNNTMQVMSNANNKNQSFLLQPRTRRQSKLAAQYQQQQQPFHQQQPMKHVGSSEEINEEDFFSSTANLDKLIQEQFQTTVPITNNGLQNKALQQHQQQSQTIENQPYDEDVAELLDIFNSTTSLQQNSQPTSRMLSHQHHFSNMSTVNMNTNALSVVANKSTRAQQFDISTMSPARQTIRSSPIRRILPRMTTITLGNVTHQQSPCKLNSSLMMTGSITGLTSKSTSSGAGLSNHINTNGNNSENTMRFHPNQTLYTRPMTRSAARPFHFGNPL